VPTGVHIRDAREQLFDAARRVLLRDGPSALTSRAVTAEAGVAKGVLHRHFADFDAFLAELVHDHAQRIDIDSIELHASAGSGTVVHNLAAALTALFESVALPVIALVIFRDELRVRLRESWPIGVPILAEAVNMVDSYLRAERSAGRIAGDADTIAMSRALIGTAYLRFADRKGLRPTIKEVQALVAHALR